MKCEFSKCKKTLVLPYYMVLYKRHKSTGIRSTYNLIYLQSDLPTIQSTDRLDQIRSVDKFFQSDLIYNRQIGKIDWLSYFCRWVVQFLQISCLIFVDWLSYFCRSRFPFVCRSVVPFLQIGCLIFVDRLSNFD